MTEQKVIEILAQQLRIDKNKITGSTNIATDLGADSLDLVEILMSLEEEFDLGELEDEALENLRTVGDVVNLIASKQ